jgi:predicted CoA-binding protein
MRVVDETERLLRTYDTITVVGASRDPRKEAHAIPAQMQRHGWRIIPVNPYADELFGEKAYPTLADVPEPLGLVDVFRPSEDAAEIVRQAIAAGASAVWLQLGIVSAEARALAEAAGIAYVEDRCLAVERARYALGAKSST